MRGLPPRCLLHRLVYSLYLLARDMHILLEVRLQPEVSELLFALHTRPDIFSLWSRWGHVSRIGRPYKGVSQSCPQARKVVRPLAEPYNIEKGYIERTERLTVLRSCI